MVKYLESSAFAQLSIRFSTVLSEIYCLYSIHPLSPFIPQALIISPEPALNPPAQNGLESGGAGWLKNVTGLFGSIFQAPNPLPELSLRLYSKSNRDKICPQEI